MSFFYGYKKQIDDLPTTGGEMTGDINMGNNKIIISSDPTDEKHLARKKYVDDGVGSGGGGNYLAKTGGIMTGNLNMGSNKVISSATPTNVNDLIKKTYVDNNFLIVDKTKQHWGNQMDELKGNIMTKNFQIYTSQTPNDGYSLTNKNYVDSEDNKRLLKSGGSMTGSIAIGNNKILTTADPTADTDLSRKKYVDDQDNKKVSKSGDTMSGDLNMGNYKIWVSSNPTSDKHLTRKKYVDDQDEKKVSKSGDTMTGDLNMGNHNIIQNNVPSSDNHVVTKKYMLPNTIANIYNLQMDDEGIFDATKDDIDYIEYTGSNKKVETLLNVSRKKDWNFTQNDTNKQPFFKKSTINNNFYCVQYNTGSNNLHLTCEENILSYQYLNFYFVYGLKSLNSSNNEVSLFKIIDNETVSQPTPFNFGISYRNSLLYITNSSAYSISNSRWQLKANAKEINKLICLSVHWDQNNLSGGKKGKLYVNGKEIVSFITNSKLSHNANMKFYLGSKNKDHGKMDGEILYVYISSRKMKEKEIVLNHYLLCKRFDIDFDEDEVIKYI